MEELSAVLIGAVSLHVFFRAIESRWPASYFALASGPDYALSRNLVRYFTFRLAPVFAVGTFAAVSLSRSMEPVVLPVILIGFVHALLTSGRALLALFRSRNTPRRPLLVAMHPVVIFLVTATAGIAALLAGLFKPYVPDVHTLSSDLWTGVVAGIVGAYAVRVAQNQSIDTQKVLQDSRRTIGDELWHLATAAAGQHGADAALVRGVMLVENIQRPRWFRRAERQAARLFSVPATLGLLQANANPDDSEAELLERAVEQHFSAVNVRDQNGDIDVVLLEEFARRYNPDSAFVELLIEAVHWAK